MTGSYRLALFVMVLLIVIASTSSLLRPQSRAVPTPSTSPDSSMMSGAISAIDGNGHQRMNRRERRETAMRMLSSARYGSQQRCNFDLYAGLQVEGLVSTKTPPRIIIAGAPASGKGTQCEKLVKTFGLIHLSTGDMLREAVKAGTDVGVKAKTFMDNGQLVPDELITDLVLGRLRQKDCSESGWLLDGFPRTKAQADSLTQQGFYPDCFVLLDVPEEELVERVTGRRIDPETGKIYHLKNAPPPADVVSRLVQRSDDTAEKIVKRYSEFVAHVDSVKEAYKNVFIWIEGRQDPVTVGKVLQMSILDQISHQKKTA